MSTFPAVAYKVLTSDEMAEFRDRGHFAGSPADLADGFIHLSTAEQLAGTIAKHFAGQSRLFVATIDLTTLAPAIRWEPSRGDQLFPHIYGTLPLSAVLDHCPLESAEGVTEIKPCRA